MQISVSHSQQGGWQLPPSSNIQSRAPASFNWEKVLFILLRHDRSCFCLLSLPSILSSLPCFLSYHSHAFDSSNNLMEKGNKLTLHFWYRSGRVSYLPEGLGLLLFYTFHFQWMWRRNNLTSDIEQEKDGDWFRKASGETHWMPIGVKDCLLWKWRSPVNIYYCHMKETMQSQRVKAISCFPLDRNFD